jgi:hypothetical protein
MNVLLAMIVMMLAVVGESRADDTGLFADRNATTASASVTWATTMPSIELSGQPLEKVLNEIKAKCPGFEFTVRREGVPDDYPVLPLMSMHGGSLEDFVRLLPKAVAGLDVTVEGGDIANLALSAFPTRFTVTIGPDPEEKSRVVRVFGLEDLVAYRASLIAEGTKDNREKQATNDILSAVQAAVDLAEEQSAPVMKVHAATHTLLFKGTAAQAEIAANALAALQPADDSHSLRGAFSTVVAENRELKEQLAKLKGATTQPITEGDASTRPIPSAR